MQVQHAAPHLREVTHGDAEQAVGRVKVRDRGRAGAGRVDPRRRGGVPEQEDRRAAVRHGRRGYRSRDRNLTVVMDSPLVLVHRREPPTALCDSGRSVPRA
jgi:hypothetical protein